MIRKKYGFVYIWYDKKHRRFYIGCHWGYEDDGYICSSRWMRSAYKRRFYDFRRRIIKSNIKSIKEMFIEEKVWLNMIKKEELGKKYYNLITTDGHWMSDENKIKIIKMKKSEAMKGEKNPFYGKHHSEEAKRKMSESTKGEKSVWFGRKHTPETIQKLKEINTGEGNPMYGKQCTKEHKEKISCALIGIKRSSETKKKMSIAKKNQKPVTEETKKKMSISAKNRHLKNKKEDIIYAR